MAIADPVLIGIDSKTFPLVRKGYDPDEVRTYLLQLSSAVDALRAAAVVPPPPPPALVPPALETPDDETLAAARAELAQLRVDQAAVRAWFGEDGRATPDQVPEPVRDAAATADALVRAAEAQAAALAPAVPAPVDPAPVDPFAAPVAPLPVEEPAAAAPAAADPAPPQRWDELGESVARILAGAEEEANAIRAAAETSASITREEAEHLRTKADDSLARAQREADEITIAAEVRASELRQAAEDGARTHIAEVLAQAEVDLERTRRELDAAHVQLTEIHASVSESLAKQAPRRELDDVDTTYAAAVARLDDPEGDVDGSGSAATIDGAAPPAPLPPPPPPRAAAPTVVENPTPPEPPLPVEPVVAPDPFAAPVTEPVVAAVEPVLAGADAGPAPAPDPEPPADPFAGVAVAPPPAPPVSEGVPDPFAAPVAVGAEGGADPAPVRGILADRASEPDDPTWSPRRTFAARLGLGADDPAPVAGEAGEAPADVAAGWEPPAPPPGS